MKKKEEKTKLNYNILLIEKQGIWDNTAYVTPVENEVQMNEVYNEAKEKDMPFLVIKRLINEDSGYLTSYYKVKWDFFTTNKQKVSFNELGLDKIKEINREIRLDLKRKAWDYPRTTHKLETYFTKQTGSIKNLKLIHARKIAQQIHKIMSDTNYLEAKEGRIKWVNFLNKEIKHDGLEYKNKKGYKKLTLEEYRNRFGITEKKVNNKQTKTSENKKPILKIERCDFPVTYHVGQYYFDNKKEFYKITYDLFPIQSKLSNETVAKLVEIHKEYYYKLKKNYENSNSELRNILGHFPDRSNSVNCCSGWVGSYWDTDAMALLHKFEEVIMNKNNWEAYPELFDNKDADFFRKDWDSSQKETQSRIKGLEIKKGFVKNSLNLAEKSGLDYEGKFKEKVRYEELIVESENIDKEILLLQELLPKDTEIISDSKTVETIIKKASEEEDYTISKYLIEKFSQAIIEGTQDFFKDIFKEQQEQTNKMKEWITESLTRSREYQRWSEHEIHSLIYLWKVQCKNPADIARLMQRSVGSIEKMIDFVESDKYLNSENFFKEVKTTIGSETK